MPTPHHLKNLAVPYNRYSLAEAAKQRLMLAVRCARCRRPPVLFLASDLMQVLDPARDCLQAPFPCSKCGSPDYVQVKLRSQDEAAIGRLVVRRLIRIKRVPVWKNEVLGDRKS